jgi:hypothetical protein
MDESIRILRINVDGQWTAKDASIFFSDLNDIYNLRLILELEREVSQELEEYYYDYPFPPRLRRLFRRSSPFRSELLGFSSRLLSAPYELRNLESYMEPHEYLRVKKLKYASPGAFDFAGIGAIVGHVKDFLLRIVEINSSKRKRQLEDDALELENQRKKIENAKLLVELVDSLGYTETEKRALLASVDNRQNKLFDLAQAQKLLSAEIIDNND